MLIQNQRGRNNKETKTSHWCDFYEVFEQLFVSISMLYCLIIKKKQKNIYLNAHVHLMQHVITTILYYIIKKCIKIWTKIKYVFI